jgi:hypothetical protein
MLTFAPPLLATILAASSSLGQVSGIIGLILAAADAKHEPQHHSVLLREGATALEAGEKSVVKGRFSIEHGRDREGFQRLLL